MISVSNFRLAAMNKPTPFFMVLLLFACAQDKNTHTNISEDSITKKVEFFEVRKPNPIKVTSLNEGDPLSRVCQHIELVAESAMRRRQTGYKLEGEIKLINNNILESKRNNTLTPLNVMSNNIMKKVFVDAYQYPRYKDDLAIQKVIFDYSQLVYKDCMKGEYTSK